MFLLPLAAGRLPRRARFLSLALILGATAAAPSAPALAVLSASPDPLASGLLGATLNPDQKPADSSEQIASSKSKSKSSQKRKRKGSSARKSDDNSSGSSKNRNRGRSSDDKNKGSDDKKKA